MATNIVDAQTVLRCPDIEATVDFFRDILTFRISTVYPADDPAVAELTGHGLNLRLERSDVRDNGRLRVCCREPERLDGGRLELVAPNGTLIELVAQGDDLDLPVNQPGFVLTRANQDNNWINGRAGMQYRDLIPLRQGGRFIASHIRIPDGGPVPDYVHYHQVRFQLIYCYKGWVRVVYEDQGDPFIMEAGDCVLQPPQIRHRVLESSVGLEVIEIGCPANHYTRVDHDLSLPTSTLDSGRDFDGQRFVRYQASQAEWRSGDYSGFLARETGIAQATDNLAGVRVFKPEQIGASVLLEHDGEFLFWFVLEGNGILHHDSLENDGVSAGDAITIPAGMPVGLRSADRGLRVLEVSLPARLRG